MAEKQLPSTVLNHFRNVRLFKEQELGHGSFATVCRAQCDDLPCAAKVLHSEFFDQQNPDPGEQTFIAKFIEECKILPSIAHPNIVQCFGTYQDPETDLPVLLMELMDESLTSYIERSRDTLPYHIEVSVSYDIALGLSYLHSRGYVHRDLSSNNVLIMAGVRAKITDFGMCRAMTGPSYRQTRLTLCPGTHPFMPPEALVDPPTYTDKLDIFSLGVLMIQIMSRQYPKPGPAHRQLRTMLLQAIPEEERRSNHVNLIHAGHPMLPVAKRCIQNSYHKRPSSHNVCDDLRSLNESRDYQHSKDLDSVERKLEEASLLHEARYQELLAWHQELIAWHQEQMSSIKAAHSQEVESIHQHYDQQLRQFDGRTKQLSVHTPQRQQLAQLHQSRKLQHQQDDQNLFPNGHHRSTPDVQSSPSNRWVQPPPSPLLRQAGEPIAQHMPAPCPNSKDSYNHLDTTTDKSNNVDRSILYDPSNLPEPAFDAHDLEIFHQEVLQEGITSSEDTCISQTLLRILTIDDGAPTSHVTSMELSSSDDVHSEAHNSLESGSPHPSLESKPSRTDPYSSTPLEKAQSACSGDKVFKESPVHSSFGEPWVDVSVDEKDSKDASTNLDSLPRRRDRASAFSAKSVSDKSQKTILSEEGYIRASTDILNAKNCWYCTNLTTLEICDICGNYQTKRKATV